MFSPPYISFFHLLVNGFSVTCNIYVCEPKKIVSDRLAFSNIHSRTSCRIYTLALPLLSPVTLFIIVIVVVLVVLVVFVIVVVVTIWIIKNCKTFQLLMASVSLGHIN